MRLSLILILAVSVIALGGIGCIAPTAQQRARARLRQEGAYRLGSCLRQDPGFPSWRRACMVTSSDYCASHGLESGCAIDGQFDFTRRIP